MVDVTKVYIPSPSVAAMKFTLSPALAVFVRQADLKSSNYRVAHITRAYGARYAAVRCDVHRCVTHIAELCLARRHFSYDSCFQRRASMIIFHDYHDRSDGVGVRDVLHRLAANGMRNLRYVENTWIAYECR